MLKRRRIKYKRKKTILFLQKKLIVKIYKLYNSNNKIIKIKHFKNCSNQSMIILLKVSPKYMISKKCKIIFHKKSKKEISGYTNDRNFLFLDKQSNKV